jgi:hypothetical protein
VASKYASLRHIMPVVMVMVSPFFTTMPSFAQDYRCLGSCAIPNNMNSPYCQQKRVDCNNPSRSQMGSFGAIAYSPLTNNVGSTHGHSSKDEAESSAVSICSRVDKGARDCKSYVWFDRRCGAIASGDDDIVRWGVDTNESGAVNAALLSCKRNNGVNCEKIASHCSLN